MIKILGNRIILSKVEDTEDDGFGVVKVQDSFVNKGKVEQIGSELSIQHMFGGTSGVGVAHIEPTSINIGDIVLFAKYSPDTQEIEHEGKDYKIVSISDVLAIV